MGVAKGDKVTYRGRPAKVVRLTEAGIADLHIGEGQILKGVEPTEFTWTPPPAPETPPRRAPPERAAHIAKAPLGSTGKGKK